MDAPYVFGSSPDSLAQQRGFYDNINLRLAEQDREARQRAIDQQRENYIFSVKHADEQNRQNQELALRLADESYNRNLGASDRAFKMYQFGLNRGDQARQEAESNRRFGIEDAARTRGLDIQDDRLDLADKAQQDKLAQYDQQTADYKKQQGEDIQSALQRANIIVSSTNPTLPPSSHLFGLYHTQEPRKILTEDEAFGHAMRDKTLVPFVDLFQWDVPSQKFTIKGQPQYPFAPTNGAPTEVAGATSVGATAWQLNSDPAIWNSLSIPGGGMPGMGINVPTPALQLAQLPSLAPRNVLPFPAPAPMPVGGSQFQPIPSMGNRNGTPQNIVSVPRSRPQEYYNRVNQLIQSGVGGETAIAQAKKEFNIQ